MGHVATVDVEKLYDNIYDNRRENSLDRDSGLAVPLCFSVSWVDGVIVCICYVNIATNNLAN